MAVQSHQNILVTSALLHTTKVKILSRKQQPRDWEITGGHVVLTSPLVPSTARGLACKHMQAKKVPNGGLA